MIFNGDSCKCNYTADSDSQTILVDELFKGGEKKKKNF